MIKVRDLSHYLKQLVFKCLEINKNTNNKSTMKFTAALLAVGAQAISLSNDSAEFINHIIDWDGNGHISSGEVADLVFIARNFGIINDDEGDDLNESAESLESLLGGPFTVK